MADARRPPRAGTSRPRSPTWPGPTRRRVRAATDKEAWDALVLGRRSPTPSTLVDTAALAGGAGSTPTALLARWRAGRERAGRALRALPDGPADAVVRPADVGRPRWPPRGSWRPGPTRSTSTRRSASSPRSATGCGTSPTSACGPATSPSPRTARRRPAEEFRVELTAPSGETLGLGPGGRRADGDRAGVRLLPAGHPAHPPRRHRPGRHRCRTPTSWLDIAQCFAGPPGEGTAGRG